MTTKRNTTKHSDQRQVERALIRKERRAERARIEAEKLEIMEASFRRQREAHLAEQKASTTAPQTDTPHGHDEPSADDHH